MATARSRYSSSDCGVPYRSVIAPIVEFVTQFEARRRYFVTIIIPAFVTRNWESILHNQTSFFLKRALRAKKSRVVTTVGITYKIRG